MIDIRWSMLKRIANSGYARLTILVPIIGWLLIANDELAKLIAKATGQEHLSSPSWKIYALHAGLSIFGVGVGMFYLICPSIIKRYNSYEEFAGVDMQTITTTQLEQYNSDLQSANRPIPTQTVSGSLAFPQSGSETGRDTWQRRNADLILKTQFEYYELQDLKGVPYKLLILLIIVPGAVLTFIPSLFTIFQSFQKLYKLTIG